MTHCSVLGDKRLRWGPAPRVWRWRASPREPAVHHGSLSLHLVTRPAWAERPGPGRRGGLTQMVLGLQSRPCGCSHFSGAGSGPQGRGTEGRDTRDGRPRGPPARPLVTCQAVPKLPPTGASTVQFSLCSVCGGVPDGMTWQVTSPANRRVLPRASWSLPRGEDLSLWPAQNLRGGKCPTSRHHPPGWWHLWVIPGRRQRAAGRPPHRHLAWPHSEM